MHVNRTLKALREDALVNVRAREVRILDWEGLATLGEFDATYLQADTTPDARQRLFGAK